MIDHVSFLSNAVKRYVKLERLAHMCYFVIENKKFQNKPGGSKMHHNYPGGLIEHVAGVVFTCESMAGPSINMQVLITAAIWHDFNKIEEYYDAVPDGNGGFTITATSYRNKIGHVVGSAMSFFHICQVVQIPEEISLEILHCMLAHHGRREWGSPVEPATPEAYILHSADMLNSRQKL